MIEKIKELARSYLEDEISGEAFCYGIQELTESPEWTPGCEKWLAEQLLIAR